VAMRTPQSKAGRVGLDALDDGVMELQKGQVELSDDEVLIVTGVADEGARQKIGILLLLVREDVLRDDALLQRCPNARQIPAEILDGRDPIT
jgi:hypothetical protein